MPGVVLVTKNLIVQLEFGSIDPNSNLTDEAVGIVIVPPHCGEAGMPDTSSPAGRVSVKLTPFRTVLLLL